MASSGAGRSISKVGHGGAVEVKGVCMIDALSASCSGLHRGLWCCVIHMPHELLAAMVAVGCTVLIVGLRSWL